MKKKTSQKKAKEHYPTDFVIIQEALDRLPPGKRKQAIAMLTKHQSPGEEPAPVLPPAGPPTIPTDEVPQKVQIVQPPTFKDRELAIKELAVHLIQQFAGDKDQNTHMDESQRLLISLIRDNVGTRPYPTSREFAIKNGIPWNDQEFRDDALISFLNWWTKLGVSVERWGREEVENVLKAFFWGEKAQEKKEEPLVT